MIVQTFKITAGANTISLKGLADGVYFIEGLTDNNRFVNKIIVKKE